MTRPFSIAFKQKMVERLRFVAGLLDGEKMAVLCREFDVSTSHWARWLLADEQFRKNRSKQHAQRGAARTCGRVKGRWGTPGDKCLQNFQDDAAGAQPDQTKKSKIHPTIAEDKSRSRQRISERVLQWPRKHGMRTQFPWNEGQNGDNQDAEPAGDG